jgi:hypothetical protein
VKRLSEEFDASNVDEAYVAALLEDVHPADPSAAQMQRVWMTLERSASRPRRRRASGPVIAALVLCGATVANATLPRIWNRLQRTTVEISPAPEAAAPKTAHRRVPSAPPPLVVVPEPEPSTIASPAPAAPRPAAAAHKATPSPATVAHPADSATSGMLMVEALRERRTGNLARARELASEYRKKYPHGALYEEALSLSFQAAAMLGEEEAEPLARLYIQRYPGGRFGAQAQRVLDNAR